MLGRVPWTARLAGTRQELLSLESNGELQLAELTTPAPGYYTRNAPDDWSTFVPFKSVAIVDWNDPNVQIIDLNGDGAADILITQGNVLVWYPSLGKIGFDAPITLPISSDEKKGPAVVFTTSDLSIHLADIVRIRSSRVGRWLTPTSPQARYSAQNALPRPKIAP